MWTGKGEEVERKMVKHNNKSEKPDGIYVRCRHRILLSCMIWRNRAPGVHPKLKGVRNVYIYNISHEPEIGLGGHSCQCKKVNLDSLQKRQLLIRYHFLNDIELGI